MPLLITLTANGQPVQRLTVPTSWADVTLAQFVALLAPEPDEPRTAAELLLGLEAGALNQLAVDDVLLLAPLLEFSKDPSPVLELLPTLGLPDVGSLSWGCLVLCQQHFAAHAYADMQRNEGLPEKDWYTTPALASLPYVLAVYRCQLTYGSTDKLEQVLAAVLAAPVVEVWADGAFFLAAARRSRSGTPPKTATTTSPTTKKSRRAARTWLRDLGLRLPWTHLPKET